MKRKWADRRGWARVVNKRFSVTHMDAQDYKGAITLLCLDEVRKPLWVEVEAEHLTCVADSGYTWLQHFPKESCYVLSTMFDARGDIVEWYIDICRRHGIDEDGVPWYDDLYLDIVVAPSGELRLLDVEELDDALKEGVISGFEYDLAWREADRLLLALEEDMFPLLWVGDEHRRQLLEA